jgi:type I restriction enzyme, S subunit
MFKSISKTQKKSTQRSSVLPESWMSVPLADVGRWYGGGTPSKSNAAFWTNGTVPWVSPKDMKSHRISGAQDWITKQAVDESATNIVPQGSVLVVTRSGILQHTLPVAVTEREVALNQDLKAVTPLRNISPDYLAMGLRTFAREILHSCAKAGTTVQSLDHPLFLRFEIPVPPIEQQRRIVAEIEKQFTRLDAGIAALRNVQAKLKRYRAAVLKAACEGRLVPTEAELSRKEGQTFETGAQIVECILQDRRKAARQGGKIIEPLAPNTAALAKLPKGWAWATLDQLAYVKGGITKDQKRIGEAGSREVPYLRVANVQRGYIDLSEVKTIVANEVEIRELTLRPGDILFNEGGDRDKLGRGWIWNSEIPECIHQNHVFRARLISQGINPKFVSYYANTFGQQFFFDEGKHTTNLASISMSKLKALPVPVPPPAEQVRIVAEVERRLSAVEELEAVVSVNLRRAARLRQSILQKAFSGELV